jgi:integrase
VRCQEWFDAGNPSYEDQQEQERKLNSVPLADLFVIAGPPGTIGRKLYDELFDAAAQAMGVQRETYPIKRTRDGYTIPCAHCWKDFVIRQHVQARLRPRPHHEAISWHVLEVLKQKKALRACHAAGLQRRSAHGLRKAAATRAANAGATVAELEAIFGWSGGRMAALYIKAADRRRLAQGAMHKLANVQ